MSGLTTNTGKKNKSKTLLGTWHFIGFLQDARCFQKKFESFYFWTSLGQNQIWLLFISQEKLPTRKTVIFRQLIYNQLTAATQCIPGSIC